MAPRRLNPAFLRTPLAVVIPAVLVTVWCAPAVAQETFGTANYTEPLPPARPDPADWNLDFPVPAGHHLERRSRRNLVVEGVGLAVFFYAASGVVAASSKEEAPLWAPGVGPYIQMARTPSSNGIGLVMLAFDGIMQTFAAGMIAYGVFVPRHVLVRDVGGARVSVMPAALGTGTPGLALIGTF